MTDPAPPFSRALQALRAISAIMVMTHHLLIAAHQNFAPGVYQHYVPLEWSVDLFFVISGVVIVISTDGYIGRPGAPWRYLRARLTRVVPLYWVATTLMLGVMVALALRHPSFHLDWPKIAASFAFWPYIGVYPGWEPILTIGWTLNYEMFFYLSFFLIILLCRTMGHAVLALSVIFVALVIAGWLWPGGAPMPLRFWMGKDILCFVAGALVGLAWMRTSWRLPGGIWLAALGFAAMVPLSRIAVQNPELSDWFGMVLAALIVGASLIGLTPAQDRRVPRVLVALGDSSYSLYLSHLFILMGFEILWRRIGSEDTGWLFFGACWILSVAIGHLSWIWFEKPGLRLIRRIVPASSIERAPGR